MDTQLITIYCLCDDLLQALHHREDKQRAMSDAEVMTTALTQITIGAGAAVSFAMTLLLLDEPEGSFADTMDDEPAPTPVREDAEVAANVQH